MSEDIKAGAVFSFTAEDVRPSAQKDGSWNFNFEAGEDHAAAAALSLLRKRSLRVSVEVIE